MITRVKVWKSTNKKDVRIYVSTDDDREGCLYKSGNSWHEKDSIEGDLTEAEWEEAKKVSIWDGKWHTVYENEMPHAKPQKQESPQGTPKFRISTNRTRTNRRGQHCWHCGGWVEPGQGSLFHVDDEDEAMYGFQAGWLVQHLDGDICKAAIAEVKAEKQERERREQERQVESDRLAKRVREDTGLEEQQDWSWDDYRYSWGSVLAETEHFTAREYKDGDEIIGFVIKEK